METLPASVPTGLLVAAVGGMAGAIGALFAIFVRQGSESVRKSDRATEEAFRVYQAEIEKRVRMIEEQRDYERRQKERAMQDAAAARAMVDRLIETGRRTIAPALDEPDRGPGRAPS